MIKQPNLKLIKFKVLHRTFCLLGDLANITSDKAEGSWPWGGGSWLVGYAELWELVLDCIRRRVAPPQANCPCVPGSHPLLHRRPLFTPLVLHWRRGVSPPRCRTELHGGAVSGVGATKYRHPPKPHPPTCPQTHAHMDKHAQT